MNENNFPSKAKKKRRYVNALLILHEVSQAELAEKLQVSTTLVNQIITGVRKGCKKKGRMVRQGVADALGMTVEDLWPENKK